MKGGFSRVVLLLLLLFLTQSGSGRLVKFTSKRTINQTYMEFLAGCTESICQESAWGTSLEHGFAPACKTELVQGSMQTAEFVLSALLIHSGESWLPPRK